MKKYTISDYEKFETINGYRICPSGEYILIAEFGDSVQFGRD